jgi:hypothetical protein
MHFILAESIRCKESNLNRWHGWFVAGWCALLAHSVFDAPAHAQEDVAPRKLLVIITGESNAGGYALNTDAKPEELAPRKSVKILNNETLKFEDLDIGENNILGHAGLETIGTHSFELELANLADKFPAGELPVYLLKTGQGGSRIAQWAIDRPYYATFLERLHAAQKSLDGVEVEPVVFFTLGINDALDGTKLEDWKSAVKVHFIHLRKELGPDTPIVMTRLMKQFAPYNAAIEEICAEVSNTYSVDTLDIPLRDPYHWNYTGMKRITNRMFDVLPNIKPENQKGK